MDNDLFQIVDVQGSLRINEDNLEGEMAACPSQYFGHASMVADAEQMVEHLKTAMKAYEAEKAKVLKAQDSKGMMKEADLDRECSIDPKWKEMDDKRIEFQTYVKKLKVLAAAFEMKSRLLTSLNRRDLFKRSQGMSGDLPYKDEY